MIFVGVDAAWGNVNETGLVCLETTGDVRDAGWAIGLQPVVDWIVEHAEPDTLVFIDAPLIVTNATGQRLCETHVGQRYWRASRRRELALAYDSPARRRAVDAVVVGEALLLECVE